MVQQWLRRLCWRPFAMQSRNQPYVPFHATVTQPVAGVTCIQINNRITRFLSYLGGGYDFAVCYLIDQSLLIDTGFSWSRQCLQQVLEQLGADQTITTVINTHYHEDHTGNNDLLYELTGAPIMAHPLAIPEIRFPTNVAWYRDVLFGPTNPMNVMATPAYMIPRTSVLKSIICRDTALDIFVYLNHNKGGYSVATFIWQQIWTVNLQMQMVLCGSPV